MKAVLIEAEAFDDYGGWSLDSQFVETVGSPYLIAHGLGEPVAAATTRVALPDRGTWHVWVRTKNWVPGEWEASPASSQASACPSCLLGLLAE